MRNRSFGFVGVVVLTLASAACSAHAPEPSPASPTSAAVQSGALPAIWDTDASTGVLPGGTDGEVVFGGGEGATDAFRLEGVVTAVRGTCPNIGLRVDNRIVRTFQRTIFEGQRCAAIAVRDRVAVIGRPIGDDLVGALRMTSRKP
jgi:hypothetical protein